ncbi:hypothetical protein [Paracidovorax citrulli]
MPHLSHTIPTSLQFASLESLHAALQDPRDCAPRCIQYCAPFSVNGHTFELNWEDRGAALLGNSRPDDEVTEQVANALQGLCARSRDLTLPLERAPGTDLPQAMTRYLKKGKLLIVRLPHRGSEYKVEKSITGGLSLVDYSRGRFPLLQAFWDALRGLFSTKIRAACEQQKALEAAIRKNLAQEGQADGGASAGEPALDRLDMVTTIATRRNARPVADSPDAVDDKHADRVQDEPEPGVHDKAAQMQDGAPGLQHEERTSAEEAAKKDAKEDARLPAEQAMLDVQVVMCEPDATAGCDLEGAPGAGSTPSPHQHGTTAGCPGEPFDMSQHTVLALA